MSAEKNAADLYEDFHRYPPRKIGEFSSSFKIPNVVYKQGKAINVLYRSLKTDPETFKRPRKPVDYIHDHDSEGVTTYLVGDDGEPTDVPDWIRDAPALAYLGDCLGFAFEDPSGKKIEAQGTPPLPELYAVQVRRFLKKQAALLVVQSKRTVLAIVWGGKLRVEPRGIVG